MAHTPKTGHSFLFLNQWHLKAIFRGWAHFLMKEMFLEIRQIMTHCLKRKKYFLEARHKTVKLSCQNKALRLKRESIQSEIRKADTQWWSIDLETRVSNYGCVRFCCWECSHLSLLHSVLCYTAIRKLAESGFISQHPCFRVIGFQKIKHKDRCAQSQINGSFW